MTWSGQTSVRNASSVTSTFSVENEERKTGSLTCGPSARPGARPRAGLHSRFARVSQGGLAPRLGEHVAPAVDVCQNVVPQRRVLGVGPLLEPGAREPLRLVESDAAIQIELGEIEVALGESRVAIDGLAIGPLLGVPLTELFVEPPEVERRLEARARVPCDLALVLRDRGLRVVPSLGEERQ